MWRRVSCEQQLDTLFFEEIRVFQACTCEQVCRCRETGALRGPSRSCAVGAVCARGAQFSFLLSVSKLWVVSPACLFMLTDALDDS